MENISSSGEGLSVFPTTFAGIRCAVLVLIINATFILYKEMGKYYLNYIIMAVSFILLVFFKVNAIQVLLADVAVSLIASRFLIEDH